MNYKNVMLDSLKESFTLVWKNKMWFIALLILQISLFGILSAVSYHYQMRIVEHSNSIFDYISKLNLNEAAVAENLMQQKSIFGDDPLLISREFSDILRNLKLLFFSTFVLLVLFLSLGWLITSKIVHKIKLKLLITSYSKILVVLLCYLGAIFLLFYYLLNVSLSQISLQTSMLMAKYLLFAIVSIVLAYFMFISLSLIQKIGFRDLFQKTLVVGIKKFHYVLGIYAINIFLSVTSIILFHYFFEKSILVLFFSILLLIFSFVFGRILMINAFEKLD